MTCLARCVGKPVIGIVCLVVLASCAPEQAASPPPPGSTQQPGEPRTAAWAAIVDDLGAPPTDRDASPCHRGEAACLDAVIAEMEARLAELGCDHHAPFAFTYLLMTRGVAAEQPSFEDPALLGLIDARFAQLYFDAVDNWNRGRLSDVPAAWQIAFAAAENGETSAAADLILGMNAHISRDLAYTVAGVLQGEGQPVEETEDYRRINEVIADVSGEVLDGVSERFDPNLFLLDQDLDVTEAPDPIELIALWRSRAFDLGVALAQAGDADERASVRAEIERFSAAGASLIITADTAQRTGALDGLGPLQDFRSLDPAERDQYCAEQLDAADS